MSPAPGAHPDFSDDPTYWLITMDLAVHRGDFECAAFAKRQLVRLGVDVNLFCFRRCRPVLIFCGTLKDWNQKNA